MPGTALAQALEGTFSSGQKGVVSFSIQSFRFRGDQFDYRYVGCTEMGLGKGHYTLRDDTLKLHFEPMSPPSTVHPMACQPVSQQFPGAPDANATRFCFTVTDAASRQPLDYVTIRSQRQPLRSTQTNSAGEAVLTYSPEPSDSLIIGWSASVRVTIALGNLASQGFQVALAQPNQIPVGTIYTYVVGKRTSKNEVMTFTDSPTVIGKVYTRVLAHELRRYPIF